MYRSRRKLGTLLVIVGIGVLAWALVVWVWQDPFTAPYTRWQQLELAQRYSRLNAAYRAPRPNVSSLAAARQLRTGDHITLSMPYATFIYSVTGHCVVRDDHTSC